MERMSGRCVLFVLPLVLPALAGVGAVAMAAGASPRGTSTARAADLVAQALDAELAGDASRRQQLLNDAVAADGEYAPARWHLGQVQFEGKWQTPEEVGEVVSNDERWKRYRELRDASSGSATDHASLARWCMRNGLSNEERYHWCNVILAAPAHKQARHRLNLREFRGGLFTAEQVAEYERRAKQADAKLKMYKPRYAELVRQARGEGKSQREAALAKIRAVTDPGAVEAIEAAIGRRKRADADPTTRDLKLALVTALAAMRDHDATLRLLNYSLFSESDEVRRLAAESLRSRPTTDYVPLLMGAMTAPIDVEFDVVAAPDGTVRMISTLHQSGPEVDAAHVQSTNFEVAGAFGRDRRKRNPGQVLSNHLSRAHMQAARMRARVDSFNVDAAARNARIQQTIKTATGMDGGSDPEKYWSAWKADIELYYDEEPTYETYDEETYTYVYDQAPRYATSSVSTPRPTPTAHSCFAPGTPVWTQSGPRPIEEIVVGDLVLAQNPTSGELGFRPVLQTTIGEPIAVVCISLPDETITATLGHRFWVNGVGWQMAKQLKPTMAIHAVAGSLDVAAIDKGADIACHNLVVDEFHTFFVGKSKLLVHDKSCPAPVPAEIPGRTLVAGGSR